MTLPRTLLFLLPLLAVGLFFFLREDGENKSNALSLGLEGSAQEQVDGDEPSAELSQSTAGLNREAVTADAVIMDKKLAAPSQAAALRRVEGRVVNSNGNGVGEAKVWLLPRAQGQFFGGLGSAALASTQADTEGRFGLDYAGEASELVALAAMPGFQLTREDIRVGDSQVLELLPAMVLSGVVLDSAGKPLANAQVVRRAEDGGFVMSFRRDGETSDLPEAGTAISDAQGRFELPYELAGPFTLDCSHAQHPMAQFSGEALEGQTYDVTIQMPFGASLVGQVRDIPADQVSDVFINANPMGSPQGPGSRFSRPERRVPVGVDGSFEIPGLLNGADYEVWASLSGEAAWNQSECSDRVPARPGSGSVTLRYEAGARLKFLVTDAASGAAIEDMEIKHDWKGSGVVSLVLGKSPLKNYPDGRVSLENLRVPRAGSELKLSIRVPGYQSEERTLVFSGGETMDLGMIALEQTGKVVVTVTDRHGAPVAGAEVEFSDPNGLKLLNGLNPGADGEGTRTTTFAMTFVGDTDGGGGAAGDLDLGGLTGQQSVSGVTDEQGRCELTAPDLEHARLQVSADDFASYKEERVFLTGQSLQALEVELSQGGNLLVRVVDADGVPVQGKEVQLHEADRSQKTNKAGLARFDQIAVGLYHAQVKEQNSGGPVLMLGGSEREVDLSEWASAGVLEGEDSELTIALAPTGGLRGTITAAGSPLASASLSLTPKAELEGQDAQAQAMRAAMRGFSQEGDRTDSRGRFEIEDLDVGEYVLEVTHRDRQMPYREEVSVRRGDNRLDLDLLDTVVSGRVRGPDGKPLAGVAVTVAQEAEAGTQRIVMRGPGGAMLGGGKQVSTDEDGQYELTGLMADTPLVISLSRAGYVGQRSEPFEVPHGLRKDDFNLKLAKAVELVAILPERPNGFVLVLARAVEGGAAPSMAKVEGDRALFDDLGPGTYTISRRDPGGAVHEEETVTLVAGQDREIRLDGTDE